MHFLCSPCLGGDISAENHFTTETLRTRRTYDPLQSPLKALIPFESTNNEMQESEEVRALLTAIRDGQREHLAEYKRVAQRSLELRERAVTRQEQFGRLYRRMILFAFLIIIFIIALIIYLLGKLHL